MVNLHTGNATHQYWKHKHTWKTWRCIIINPDHFPYAQSESGILFGQRIQYFFFMKRLFVHLTFTYSLVMAYSPQANLASVSFCKCREIFGNAQKWFSRKSFNRSLGIHHSWKLETAFSQWPAYSISLCEFKRFYGIKKEKRRILKKSAKKVREGVTILDTFQN